MRTKNDPTDQNDPTFSFIEAARRAQIIACAIKTIAELGFARASLAQIANRAGISKGVISYHFEDKNDLIEQVVADVFGAGVEYMRPQIEAALPDGPTATLQAYIRSNLEFIRAHPQQMLALVEIFTTFRTPEGKPRYTTADAQAALAPLKELLQWGQETEEFRAFDLHVMAVTIRQAIDAVPSLMSIDPNLDLDVYTEELVTLFHHATRKES